MKKSSEVLRNFISIKNLKIIFKNMLHFKWNIPLRNSMLLAYGLANALFLVAYMAYVVISFHAEILNFPIIILSLIQKASAMRVVWSDFPKGFLWILGLYVILAKIIFQLAIKKIRQP